MLQLSGTIPLSFSTVLHCLGLVLAEGLRISVGNYAIAAEQGKERRNVPA